MIALPGTDELEALRARLEEQYEGHTERLAALMGPERRRHGRPTNAAAKMAAASVSRRALAEVARALQRMADGTYGHCERCTVALPFEQLDLRPADRFCVGCR